MELKYAYKQTPIGMMPEEWKVLKMGELATIQRGASPRPIDSPIWFDSKSSIGWLRISDITKSSKYLTQTSQGLSNKGVENSRLVRAGNLVMSICATVGRPILLCKDVCIHDGFVVFNNLCLDKEYLYYILISIEKSWGNHGQTGSQMNLNTGLINSTPIPVPPIQEQMAIAKALSDADAWIQSLTQLIAKKRQIKQGAMQTLLHPYENGKLKDGWEEMYLDEIADVIDPHPSHRAPPVDNSGIPFIGIGDIDENGDIRNSGLRLVSKSVLNEHRTRYQLDDKLIGLGRVASIGKVVKLKNALDDYVISPTLGVIKGKSVPPDYLFYILNSKFIKEQFNKIMSGSTRSSVGMNVLRKLKVPIIESTSKQIEILKFLNDIDEEIKLLESKLSKAKKIKNGMMQNLLTGRIRLI
ncbi:TPA: restriction endonuclease subunit S [Legionella pneumophila]